MGFISLCQSDPIMDWIRLTYNAIPLKVPDPRLTVLTLFTNIDKKVRYLGNLRSLTGDSRWSGIRVDEVDLPDVSQKTSSQMSLAVVFDLLGPFVREMTGALQLDLFGSVDASRHRDVGARITLSHAKRSFIQPVACASALAGEPIGLPPTLKLESTEGKQYPILMIDSVLSASEIALTIDGEGATEVGLKLESELAGKTSADSVFRTKSRLVIRGKKRAPFAFTCLQLDINSRKEITGLSIPRNVPRLGATGVQTAMPLQHARVGESNELITFDE